MMREFGVKIENSSTIECLRAEDFEEIIEHFESEWYSRNGSFLPKIYVAKESEEIFKPRIDDMGIIPNNPADPMIFYYEGWQYLSDDAEDRLGDIDPDSVEIIMRDNKHFIDCEVENG